MPDTLSATPLPALGLYELGEGPVWDDLTQYFHWVDINTGRFFRHDPATGATTHWEMGARCGFAVPTNRPGIWLAARGAEVVCLDLATGDATPFHRLDPETDFRCNDGKCDPQGRLWAGTVPLDWGNFTGALYRVTAAAGPAAQRRQTGCSNGLAWSPDGRFCYFIDSLTGLVDRYSWSADTGTIFNRETLANYSQVDDTPDGMCIDAEGHLWVAFYNGHCVRRLDGLTGAELAKVELPVAQVTSCAFGGPDLATLYITTAFEGLDAAARAPQPLAGSLFTCQPDVRGLPVDRFRF
ncbi:SMP-30/gluconolactonase/LRE family protein [Actomonas aquatica]|uniref:SMP-30/gluconolactonase/LRE family protein n=1 Tax=Actomonas aquatica TaxID=2866162 RepID=A0ABZ1C7P0_9BACT|nr:SMP-30/gluconolactonase/LRE family protein [Opitutus sp. WL0086]WRQ87655.1 SMP-30/gluconolactonase/LRE family protein [Opitutus sp. WL0086]